MIYKNAVVAFMGVFLLFAAPAFGQASVGPDAGQDQEILVASASRDSAIVSDAGASVATSSASEDYCPTRDVLAHSEYAVSCNTGTREFFERVFSACAKGRPSPDTACAAIVYTIDPELSLRVREEYDLPITMTVKIGKIAVHDGDLMQMVATIVKSNGSTEQLIPKGINDLLAPIKIDRVVRVHKKSGAGTRFDEKREVETITVRYYSALFLTWKDARKLKAEQHFYLPIQVRQDLEKLLNPRCLMYKLSC